MLEMGIIRNGLIAKNRFYFTLYDLPISDLCKYHQGVNDCVCIIVFLFVYEQKPDRDEWGCGLDAMQVALSLEKNVNQSLLDLHVVASKHNDAQVRLFGDELLIFLEG